MIFFFHKRPLISAKCLCYSPCQDVAFLQKKKKVYEVAKMRQKKILYLMGICLGSVCAAATVLCNDTLFIDILFLCETLAWCFQDTSPKL